MTSSDASPSEKVLDVGGIIIDPLDGYLSFAEHANESMDKRRADDIANVAFFGGAASENEGQVLADAVDQVVVCSAVGDSEAGRWSHRSVEAGEAAVGSFSTDIIEDRDQWLEQGRTWQPIKD